MRTQNSSKISTNEAKFDSERTDRAIRDCNKQKSETYLREKSLFRFVERERGFVEREKGGKVEI